MPLDIQALGAELAGVIAAQMAPLVKRIEAIEESQRKSAHTALLDTTKMYATERQLTEAVTQCAQVAKAQLEVAIAGIPKGDKGDKGDSVTMAELNAILEGAVAKWALEFERRSMDLLQKAIDKIPTPKDGKDGVSFESFEMDYIGDAHEVRIKATAGGQTKELRFPAGGIRPGGFWRDGTKALAGQAWSEGGNLWIAVKDTSSKPAWDSPDWFKAASKGRDAETKAAKNNWPAGGPIPLKG